MRGRRYSTTNLRPCYFSRGIPRAGLRMRGISAGAIHPAELVGLPSRRILTGKRGWFRSGKGSGFRRHENDATELGTAAAQKEGESGHRYTG